MPDPASDPGERARQFAAIRDHSRRAVIGLARDRGAEFTTRPSPDSGLTVRDLEPLTGVRAARGVELGARHAARDYIRQAREAGHSWDQIGQALGVSPNADADQTGLTVAEAAYTYAAGSPHTDTAIRYGRSFVWRCRSCDQAISDRGPIAGPADDEPGHTGGCPRLAAAVAEWDAGWEGRAVTAQRVRRRLVLADDGIIDVIAVELAARGARLVALTRAERQLAAARVLARGGTACVISKRLRVSGTTALTLAAQCHGVAS